MKTISKGTGLWIGPSFKSKGGVASVIETYFTMDYFARANIHFLASMEDGNKWGKFRLFFLSLMFFLRHIRSWRMVHVHMSSQASFWRKSVFIVLAALFRIPVIIHLHSSSFPGFYFGSGIFSKAFIRYVFRKASKILVLSAPMMELVTEFGLMERSCIFPNPVITKPVGQAKRKENTLLFIGRITREKGIFELVRAIGLVRKSIPGVMVWVAGTGQEDLMRAEVRQLGLEDHFQFLGWISGEEKTELLGEATVMVSPSYGEGQSISILESMMAGLPVICTSVGGNEFLLGNPPAGVIVPAREVDPLADAIVGLLENESARTELAKLGKNRIEQGFNYFIVENELNKIYNSLPNHQNKKLVKIYGEL
ncbi:glycosyltransferase family 4 protein [Flavihumibacter stibioxidans]|uniref:Glycosyltransferase involved in cell wall biosynthesis n=1 Tax=Flavihumibacter stibioxidans TaxID=1834163 RepID=A0ABR7M4M0_9BACT|nr:glycosyltransferase family 4 protein [Flavihumibacter stibioxidans]MBC6489950.1 hypothetical protein [Flavihumibacter stibioxidans]